LSSIWLVKLRPWAH